MLHRDSFRSPSAMQIKKDFQDIVLSARQDEFYSRNMYANFGDIGMAVKVPSLHQFRGIG